MKKIAIIGYSGCGKSTLAHFLGEIYNIPVLYADAIHFLPGWVDRTTEDNDRLMKAFLDENTENGWVVDGNYTNCSYERRMEESDELIFMNFNRLSCLVRVYKRYFKYKGKIRESSSPGCPEKIDLEFVKWVLWEGRTKARKNRYKSVCEKYSTKLTVIKNQKELDAYMDKVRELNCC